MIRFLNLWLNRLNRSDLTLLSIIQSPMYILIYIYIIMYISPDWWVCHVAMSKKWSPSQQPRIRLQIGETFLGRCPTSHPWTQEESTNSGIWNFSLWLHVLCRLETRALYIYTTNYSNNNDDNNNTYNTYTYIYIYICIYTHIQTIIIKHIYILWYIVYLPETADVRSLFDLKRHFDASNTNKSSRLLSWTVFVWFLQSTSSKPYKPKHENYHEPIREVTINLYRVYFTWDFQGRIEQTATDNDAAQQEILKKTEPRPSSIEEYGGYPTLSHSWFWMVIPCYSPIW